MGVLLSWSASAGPLAWQAGDGFRSAALAIPQAGKTGFTRLSPELTGVLFTNRLVESRSLTNHILLNGSGVAAGDIDGDGWCDLYFCGLDGANVLYRNLGKWRFQDITGAAGVACEDLDATGAVFADVDGDGDLDLLVNSIGHGTHCFLNDGQGHFCEVTGEAGLTSGAGSMSMALGDIDGDGSLDLYVANYRTWTMRDAFRMRLKISTVRGKPVITVVDGRPVTEPDLVGRMSIDEHGNIIENGEADVLYRNDGRGHFSPVSFVDGHFLDEEGRPLSSPPYDWGLSVMFRDLNGDALPDLVVCNDLGSTNRVWINDGAGRFRAIRRLAMRKSSWFSMGLDIGDLNRDGHDEIYVTDMVSRSHRLRQVQISDHKLVHLPVGAIEDRPKTPRNTLYLNLGDGDYAELAYFSALDASEWSWAPVFLDVDLDGYEDVLIVTGFERDVQDIDIAERLERLRQKVGLSDAEALRTRRMFPRLDLPNLAFHNRGDLTFEEVGAAWGFDTAGVSQGMALADLDNDGDLDVVINNMNTVAGVYRNDATSPRVAIRLRGQPPNTRGVGAKIWLSGGAVSRQSQEMICGGRYLSGDDAVRVFAAGSLTNEMRIEVRWRSGKRSVVEGVRANRIYEIDEAFGQPWKESPESEVRPWFEDVSHLIQHTHRDEGFDDFARQALLPRKLSQLGPGVSWYDVDEDGWEDLIIGSGKGGQLAVYRNDGHGTFKRLVAPFLDRVVTRDQTGVLGWTHGAGKTVILAGSANYEDGLAVGSCIRAYDLNEQRVEDGFAGYESSTGPLALADVDGDGDLDLFVGGRVIPGRYPEPATSRLFRNHDGRFAEDREASQAFDKVGLVSGAVFSDLDADGYPDMILACEWGPLRVFHNEAGKTFAEVTGQLGFDRFLGWWNGVTTGDVDGDGRMDIIASNMGQNTKYERHREQPLRLFYGDFNGTGGVDVIEAYYDRALDKIVPWQHLGRVGPALPFVRTQFGTFREFGGASVAEILGDRVAIARELKANELESAVFLNRGDRFEARPLPMPAQWSPAFAVCVCDMDGDGNEDLFLSQNFFATEPETGRYDSGRGLWLRGDGRGGFTAVPGRESGVRIYGEQRGAAVCDYDADGRVDLVVTQNGAQTKLYRNKGAQPGLRIRLRGTAGNPLGIGALVRLSSGSTQGPAREVHAGSGYWSQDSAVLVMSSTAPPTEVIVRWPGGKATNSRVPSYAREIELTASGGLRVLR
jgi:hypothetical protein